MFLAPALLALTAGPTRTLNADGTLRVRFGLTWIGVVLIIAMAIGFRYNVGGDWNEYFRYLFMGYFMRVEDLRYVDDPGFMAVTLMSVYFGWNMTGMNIMAGLVLGFGIVAFVRSLPRPWLGLACAIPYLVIVVGMGYTRQAMALGFVMVGLVELRREQFFRFALWVALGALFHKTAVLMIPIAILTGERLRLQAVGLVGLVGFVSYDALLAQHTERLVDVYIENEAAESQGAFIRLLMNVVPAILFLVYQRRFLFVASEARLWRIVSWTALAMFVALLTTGFTTVLDRLALYIIPLQLAIFSHLPDALGRPNGRNASLVACILLYYATVQFVWLNFASHSNEWVPYQTGWAMEWLDTPEGQETLRSFRVPSP